MPIIVQLNLQDRGQRYFFIHMNLHFRFIIVLFFFLCQQLVLSGQDHSVTGDEAYPGNALVNAKRRYLEALNGQSGLYNGRQYNFRYLDIKGTPFYGGTAWNTGDILYDNQLYEGIHMKLDIYNNILVIDYYDSRGKFYILRLQNERIEYFRWPGHYFIHIKQETPDSYGLAPGFYDLLYDGNIRVLARYTKFTTKNNSPSEYQLEAFDEKDHFFIVKDSTIFQVKKRHSLLSVFSDKEGEINTYIKKHRLKFRDQPGLEIAEVAAYYDKIHE